MAALAAEVAVISPTGHRLRPTRRLHAFSLLEVLIAGSMFLIGVTGVVTAWKSITGVVDTQRRSTDAIVVAEDVLDELRLQHRAGPMLAIGPHERFFRRDRVEVPAPDPQGYRVAWDVSQVGNFSFRRVGLTVDWIGVDGRTHSLSFLSYRPG